MTTWGPSKKKTARSRAQQPAPSRSSGRAGGSYRSATDGSRSRGGVSSDTPPATPRGRQATTDELRRAVGGREHEFVGIGLIVAGIVIALALYFHLAGPLGRGIELLMGWIVGLGRFIIPVALIAAGVSLVRRGQSSSPVRLLVGWGLAWLALEGIAHVINGPDSFSDWDALYDSGGLAGA